MKNLVIRAALTSLFLLSACGEVSTDVNPTEAKKTTIDGIDAKANPAGAADLSQMDIPEIIDFVDAEAKDMTALLQTVTDGPTAEAAVEEIRETIPRLNVALRSMENINPENMKISIGNMRRMMSAAQSHAGLFTEVQRISQIPEARAVLEKEFDKIELTGPQ